MEPKITSKAAFTVVGLKYRGKNEQNEIPKLWQDLMEHYEEIEAQVNPHVAYGVCHNLDESTGEFDYVAGYDVQKDVQAPEGMVKWDIPQQTYAVFTCTLPTIGEAYDFIYQEWLPNSKHQRTAGPEFEFYDEQFNPQDSDSKMYLFIPIESKS